MNPRLIATLTLLALTLTTALAGSDDKQAEVRLKKDVTFLASDVCEGRGAGTAGQKVAAEYIAAEFKRLGLKPAFKDSYFQPFAMAACKGTVELTGPKGQVIELTQRKDFNPFGIRQQGAGRGGVVFVGYGWDPQQAKDGNPFGTYDDYAGVDVKDKIVVMLTGLPRGEQNPRSGTRVGQRLTMAEKKGALAVLLVNDLWASGESDRLVDYSHGDILRGGKHLPALLVKRSVVEAMLPPNKSLSDIEKSITRDFTPDSFALTGWRAAIETKLDKDAIPCRNVVGVVEGSGPLADETIVVGAHYDHLGWGGPSSGESPIKAAIHRGADDNASGTSGMLELARRFAAQKNRQGRRLVFCAFAGEEAGLFGSKAYCASPAYPLEKTAAMFNLDMIGRLRADKTTGKPRMLTEGHGTAKTFKGLIDELAKKYEVTLASKASGFGPSDHASFTAKKVPVLFFWTDTHPEYHRSSDAADKILYAGMVKIVNMSEEAVTTLTTMKDKPEFQVVKGDSGMRPSTGPRLGIRPGYAEDKPGVVVEGVTAGGPAEKGGVKDGDVIVAIAGETVKDLPTYITIMGKQKPKTTIEVEVMRDGKKVKLKIPLD